MFGSRHPLTDYDIHVLLELLDAMKENLSDKRDELYEAMKIEYAWYVNHSAVSTMRQLIDEAERAYPKSQTIIRTVQYFRKKFDNI